MITFLNALSIAKGSWPNGAGSLSYLEPGAAFLGPTAQMYIIDYKLQIAIIRSLLDDGHGSISSVALAGLLLSDMRFMAAPSTPSRIVWKRTATLDVRRR